MNSFQASGKLTIVYGMVTVVTTFPVSSSTGRNPRACRPQWRWQNSHQQVPGRVSRIHFRPRSRVGHVTGLTALYISIEEVNGALHGKSITDHNVVVVVWVSVKLIRSVAQSLELIDQGFRPGQRHHFVGGAVVKLYGP
jgi:hypothetical protein